MRNFISTRRPDCHTCAVTIPGLIQELQALGCCTSGGPDTPPTVTFTGGVLTITVNGLPASANLRGGVPSGTAVDLADTPLGYWLPLS